MTQAPPTWLTRDVIACHPQRRLIFQPLSLRRNVVSEEMIVHYTAEAALPVRECRLAQTADLLNQETTVYLGGQHYTKTLSGLCVELARGPQKYTIHLARDDCAIASFAQAFDGQIVTLDDVQAEWIDQLFMETQDSETALQQP
jgi:hypothetical protein